MDDMPRDGEQNPAAESEKGTREDTDLLADVLSDPGLMEKLPGMVAALAPVLGARENEKAIPDKRTALLLALKPYLNPKRGEAIDLVLRLWKVAEIMKGMKG